MSAGDRLLRELLELAQEVAVSAGDLLRKRLPEVAGGRLLSSGASAKSSPTDLVTDIDRASEALIVQSLLQARPDDGVQGEEGSDRSGSTGIRWVIDPLDGTINYLYGIPVFAVSVAASRDGRSIVGVVHDPMTGSSFTASEHNGSALDGHPLELAATGRPLSQALVGTGFSYSAEHRAAQARLLPTVLASVRDIRRGGSAALDICAVACGRLDAFYEAELKPWDCAAGALVAREAGATVITLEGLAPGSSTLLAAAPDLAQPMVDLLRSAGASAAGPGNL